MNRVTSKKRGMTKVSSMTSMIKKRQDGEYLNVDSAADFSAKLINSIGATSNDLNGDLLKKEPCPF